MNISPLSLWSNPSIGGISGGNPLARGKLVVADAKSAAGDVGTQAAPAKKEAQADQLELLEEARKLAEELKAEREGKDENEGRKITAQADEKPAEREQTLKDGEPADLSDLSLVVNWEKKVEKFSHYRGGGNATTSQEVDEALADKEHWMFSYGRDIDLKTAGMGSQWGMSYSRVIGDGGVRVSYGGTSTGGMPNGKMPEGGYGMRARYDASSEDSSVMIVEALDGKGNRTAYRVDLKEIDAANTSLIESFALISHLYVGQGRTEAINPFDAMDAMHDIIDQPRFDPSQEVGAVYKGSGYTIIMPVKSGMTTTDGRPGFEDRYNLLSLGIAPVEPPKDGGFAGRLIYM